MDARDAAPFTDLLPIPAQSASETVISRPHTTTRRSSSLKRRMSRSRADRMASGSVSVRMCDDSAENNDLDDSILIIRQPSQATKEQLEVPFKVSDGHKRSRTSSDDGSTKSLLSVEPPQRGSSLELRRPQPVPFNADAEAGPTRPRVLKKQVTAQRNQVPPVPPLPAVHCRPKTAEESISSVPDVGQLRRSKSLPGPTKLERHERRQGHNATISRTRVSPSSISSKAVPPENAIEKEHEPMLETTYADGPMTRRRIAQAAAHKSSKSISSGFFGNLLRLRKSSPALRNRAAKHRQEGPASLPPAKHVTAR